MPFGVFMPLFNAFLKHALSSQRAAAFQQNALRGNGSW
jgi:hypothetical protein